MAASLAVARQSHQAAHYNIINKVANLRASLVRPINDLLSLVLVSQLEKITPTELLNGLSFLEASKF